MRISCDAPVVQCPGVPLVMYSNHPSWWDPMIAIALATSRYANRTHYAPIDAAMLEKYGIFKKLGFFGVDQGSRRGPVAFLRTSQAICEQPDSCLWITAQGQFTDVRKRPIELMPGLAHLARRADACIVPIAIEYTFWNERGPNVLIRFGQPLRTSEHASWDVDQWQAGLTEALTKAADALALAGQARDATAFDTLIQGRVGTNVFYDSWRWMVAKATGKAYSRRHMHEGER